MGFERLRGWGLGRAARASGAGMMEEFITQARPHAWVYTHSHAPTRVTCPSMDTPLSTPMWPTYIQSLAATHITRALSAKLFHIAVQVGMCRSPSRLHAPTGTHLPADGGAVTHTCAHTLPRGKRICAMHTDMQAVHHATQMPLSP